MIWWLYDNTKCSSKNVMSRFANRTAIGEQTESFQECTGGLGWLHGTGSRMEASWLGSNEGLWEAQVVTYPEMLFTLHVRYNVIFISVFKVLLKMLPRLTQFSVITCTFSLISHSLLKPTMYLTLNWSLYTTIFLPLLSLPPTIFRTWTISNWIYMRALLAVALQHGVILKETLCWSRLA